MQAANLETTRDETNIFFAPSSAGVAKKIVLPKHIPGPLSVRGRNSDNGLIATKLWWRPREPLVRGIEKTYPWIAAQVAAARQRSGISV